MAIMLLPCLSLSLSSGRILFGGRAIRTSKNPNVWKFGDARALVLAYGLYGWRRAEGDIPFLQGQGWHALALNTKNEKKGKRPISSRFILV